MNKKPDSQESQYCEKHKTNNTESSIENPSFTQNVHEVARVYLGVNYPSVYFTRREVDCAKQLLTGKTMKEIGKVMGISHRSVEFYLRTMRFKLSVNTKHELFCAIRDNTDIEKDYE